MPVYPPHPRTNLPLSTPQTATPQSRPFGVALLIAGWDREAGPVLYHTDPSGTYVKYKCMAIGSGSEGALTALQEHFKPEMTLAEAEVLALATLKQVMEEKVRGWGWGWGWGGVGHGRLGYRTGGGSRAMFAPPPPHARFG